MQENVRAGMMTQEEYEKAMADMEEYATYVGDPPAEYSGGWSMGTYLIRS